MKNFKVLGILFLLILCVNAEDPKYDGYIYINENNQIIDFQIDVANSFWDCEITQVVKKGIIWGNRLENFDITVLRGLNPVFGGAGYFRYNLTSNDLKNLTVNRDYSVLIECDFPNDGVLNPKLLYRVSDSKNIENGIPINPLDIPYIISNNVNEGELEEGLSELFSSIGNAVRSIPIIGDFLGVVYDVFDIIYIIVMAFLVPLRVLLYAILFMPILALFIEVFIIGISINNEPFIFMANIYNHNVRFWMAFYSGLIYLGNSLMNFSIGLWNRIR